MKITGFRGMNGENINNIYPLQDKILNVVFGFDNSFYLTGGTALHRFHISYRISDDLDFFTSTNQLFYEEIKQICNSLDDNHIFYEKKVEVKDFFRFLVEGALQLDFVNDRVYREGISLCINNFKIDNIENILTNKICALINRDEEKDFFDLFAIAKNYPFFWEKTLNIANKKSIVEKESLILRIKTFPLIWLDKIKKIKDLEITKKDVEKLCENIFEGKDNELFKKT
jgi:hypothetical protein